jgi:hypothetical protein
MKEIFFYVFFCKIELFYIKFLREIHPFPWRHEILKSGDGKVVPPRGSSSSSATAGSSEIDNERC